MAKRFYNTELWSERWFCDLSLDARMMFFYFTGNCNHAGLMDMWQSKYEADTGSDYHKALSELISKNILTEVNPERGRYFMSVFILHQYPDWPNSRVKSQDSAIKLLESEGITEIKFNPYVRVSEPLVKGYVYDNGLRKKGGAGGKKTKPEKPKEEKKLYQEVIWLTDTEVRKLRETFGDEGSRYRVIKLSLSIQSKGTNYKSHYKTILNWEHCGYFKDAPTKSTRPAHYPSFI